MSKEYKKIDIQELEMLIMYILAVKANSFKMKNPFVLIKHELGAMRDFLFEESHGNIVVYLYKENFTDFENSMVNRGENFPFIWHDKNKHVVVLKRYILGRYGKPLLYLTKEYLNYLELYNLIEMFYKKNIFLTEEIVKTDYAFVFELNDIFPNGLTVTEFVNLKLLFKKLNDTELEIFPQNFLIKRQGKDEILFQPKTNNPAKELSEIMHQTKQQEETFFLEKKEKILRRLNSDNQIW
jgi:hypothetical protein